MPLPTVKLSQGIHVMHLFYRLDRTRWDALAAGQSADARAKLEKLCAQFPGPAQPRLSSYANVGGKADLGFVLYHADLVGLGALHRELEACFPAGAVVNRSFIYLKNQYFSGCRMLHSGYRFGEFHHIFAALSRLA